MSSEVELRFSDSRTIKAKTFIAEVKIEVRRGFSENTSIRGAILV